MTATAATGFLVGKGEMVELIRRFDWSTTSLGPLEAWPQSLKTTVGILLLSPIPIVLLWNEDGVMLYNDAYSGFAGGRHPRLLGSKVREGWPEVADFNDNVMKVGLAGGTLAYKDQELTLHRSGKPEQVWMNLDYSPVIGENGKPAGVIAIVVETTERILADRQAREAAERQRQLLTQMPGFVGVLRGPDHIYEYVNDAYIEIAGDRDYIGKAVRDLFPDLLGQGFFELLDKVYRTGERYVAHGAPVRFAGRSEDNFIDLLYEPIRDPRGQVTGIFVGGYDVTEIHNTARALRDLNADLERQVAERTREMTRTWLVSPDILGILNFDGYFERSNPAWQTILGWSEDEIRATRFFDFIHPDDLPATYEAWENAGVGMPALRFENRYRTRQGGWRWLSWVAVPEGGKIYCNARDVTAEKEAEEALRRTEDALRQSQKMEAVGQLTGGLAHDFNNLLAGISGSLELLENRLAQGRTTGLERYIGMAQSSARRATSLTQRLLAFSRRQTLDPKPIDANRLIAGMEDLIRRTVGPAITLEVVGAGGLWTTRADPPQLENALLNLSINARDAMPDGGRLTIETANKWFDERSAAERELPPGQYIAISVTDSGTGMTPEVAQRAFDPFFTTKPLGQGTGLGLSMIHGYVRQSGGQVSIYSELGRGTTVSLYLPRHLGAPEGIEEAAAPLAPDMGQGETVLVIDDDEIVRMLVADVLEEAGYRVLQAGDGPAGLRVLQSAARIDLLVTDVGLPGGVNGRQVADAARVTRPDLMVLFITGYAENAAVGNGFLAAGMQIITKPFEVAALAVKVRDMLDLQ